MRLVLGAGSFPDHCQQIKVSGQVKSSCRQEEKVCEGLRKNKLQLEQGSLVSGDPSGRYEKSWSRCADCLRWSHAVQPLSRRSLEPPVVSQK